MGTNEILGMKSIKDFRKEGLGEKLRTYTTSAWYFEKGYEKFILVVLCLLGMWKIYGWIF